jgi:predicted RNase H-like HicB family nuclease
MLQLAVGEELEEARRAGQEAYRTAFGFLTDEGRAQKAITANQTHGLF